MPFAWLHSRPMGGAAPRSFWPNTLLTALFTALPLAIATSGAGAQTSPTMGGTLRYGSGLLDIPVAGVLPHLMVRGTYSGFWTSLDRRAWIDERGRLRGFDPGGRTYASDGALSLGLFDRGEVGVSLQSFASRTSGGTMAGLFGRANLLKPVDQGLGFAIGGRYLTSPGYGDGVDLAPGRLGFPDDRLRKRHDGADRAMSTDLTLYGVATAYLRGFEGMRVPRNDLTLSLGWGTGTFRGAPSIQATELYGEGANGFFFGGSSHWQLSPYSVLTLLAEHNGFDVNVGAQVDVSGARAGVHLLGANHRRPAGGYLSEYRTPKLGITVSLAVCPEAPRFRCRPRLMERLEPDTIWIPAPPPDTVVVAGGPAAPPPLEGEPAMICLATGQNAPIQITEAGDTLVGPTGIPIEELRPAVDFAGVYAEATPWFLSGAEVLFEGGRFRQGGAPVVLDCGEILRVGQYQGIPVFADRSVIRPLGVIFIPVRVGLWQRYDRTGMESAIHRVDHEERQTHAAAAPSLNRNRPGIEP